MTKMYLYQNFKTLKIVGLDYKPPKTNQTYLGEISHKYLTDPGFDFSNSGKPIKVVAKDTVSETRLVYLLMDETTSQYNFYHINPSERSSFSVAAACKLKPLSDTKKNSIIKFTHIGEITIKNERTRLLPQLEVLLFTKEGLRKLRKNRNKK